MALQIRGVGPAPEEIAAQIEHAIVGAIPDAAINVVPGGPGHYEISVVSPIFEDKSRVQQHQLVYGAISHLMSGPQAPIHAVDRLDCRTT